MMMLLFAATGLAAAIFIYTLINHLTHPSLSRIRGPKSPSWIVGNLLELLQRPVGEADFKWQSLYGSIVRFKTVFGGDQLLVSDPKALHCIFNTSGYPSEPSLRVMARTFIGKGVGWADGEDHKRQRKVLLPGFGAPESRAFMSIFKGCAESMTSKWVELIENSNSQKVVLNIPAWLSRATLDAIGQAAFDVQFGAVQNDEHPLAKTYDSFMSDVFGRPSDQEIFVQAASKYIPVRMLEWMAEHSSNSRLERGRDMKRMATRIAREMVQEKAESLLQGKGSRDIFSLLVKANMDCDAKNKLAEEELLAQMGTILFAGQETTSNTLGWILLELARRPNFQSRLRDEIRKTEAAIRARGDSQFTIADFDAMPYMAAVIKEGLRYHPVVPHIHRIAARDGVLPLSHPITTESGELIAEVVVPKGTRIVASVAAYNRNTELWGEDAHDFSPDRWLEGVANEKKPVSIGPYSNLMTFSSGLRACLGWRFAVIEMQAFLVETVGKFEFAMTDRAERVRSQPSVIMTPMVDGELDRGAQIPLAVSIASRDDSGF